MRALVLGAETPAGRALAAALATAGARIALIAASAGADTAFDVQRLARRLGALSQAIDATNEMAVRVMTRQVSKALGGLDALFFCADLGAATAEALALACRFAAREMARAGGGAIVVASAAAPPPPEGLPEGVRAVAVDAPPAPDEAWARVVFARLPDPPHRLGQAPVPALARGQPVEPRGTASVGAGPRACPHPRPPRLPPLVVSLSNHEA
ncbi:MAG: hypothetical protein Q7R32_11405, partial [Dehalococcoidia bacterium]|nr:hypothetical protein [Dehalococcoidia bacterium]